MSTQTTTACLHKSGINSYSKCPDCGQYADSIIASLQSEVEVLKHQLKSALTTGGNSVYIDAIEAQFHAAKGDFKVLQKALFQMIDKEDVGGDLCDNDGMGCPACELARNALQQSFMDRSTHERVFGPINEAEATWLIEQNLWEVRFNSRIQEWTVQRHGQISGCMGRGKTLTAAVAMAIEHQDRQTHENLSDTSAE